MLGISNVYVETRQGKSRLCADVRGLSPERTVWFAVDEKQEHLLCRTGGECMVFGMLLLAMQSGQDIQYDGTLSKRFVHGVNEYLIPSLAAARPQYKKIKVRAANYGCEPNRPVQEVAMRFSKDSAWLNRLEQHQKDSLYPLTLLCAFCESKEPEETGRLLKETAAGHGLQPVLLEQNLGQLYETKTKDAECFLELACALALGGGVSIYLYYSENALSGKEPQPKEEKNLDIIISSFASTDALRIYLFDRKEEPLC